MPQPIEGFEQIDTTLLFDEASEKEDLSAALRDRKAGLSEATRIDPDGLYEDPAGRQPNGNGGVTDTFGYRDEADLLLHGETGQARRISLPAPACASIGEPLHARRYIRAVQRDQQWHAKATGDRPSFYAIEAEMSVNQSRLQTPYYSDKAG